MVGYPDRWACWPYEPSIRPAAFDWRCREVLAVILSTAVAAKIDFRQHSSLWSSRADKCPCPAQLPGRQTLRRLRPLALIRAAQVSRYALPPDSFLRELQLRRQWKPLLAAERRNAQLTQRCAQIARHTYRPRLHHVARTHQAEHVDAPIECFGKIRNTFNVGDGILTHPSAIDDKGSPNGPLGQIDEAHLAPVGSSAAPSNPRSADDQSFRASSGWNASSPLTGAVK